MPRMCAMTITPAEYDFRAARRRLEAKPKSAGEKLVSLAEAAARVPDGATLAIGGILYSRTPLALLREILRRRPKALTQNLAEKGERGAAVEDAEIGRAHV